MSEMVTPENLATASVVAGSAWGLKRLLGPAITSVGKVFGTYAEYQAENLLKIDEKIQRRLEGEDLEAPTDQLVHPRVVKAALDEGSWIDDDLHQEYLAGLLVGARTTDARSDAQAYLARIATDLTAAQVQLHYLTYRSYAGYWPDDVDECPLPWDDKNKYRQHAVVVPAEEVDGRGFGSALSGLLREGLVSDFGNPDHGAGGSGRLALAPSRLGADLFLAVFAPAGSVNPSVLCLSDVRRERLAATTAPRARLVLPAPEPDPFRSFEITAV